MTAGQQLSSCLLLLSVGLFAGCSARDKVVGSWLAVDGDTTKHPTYAFLETGEFYGYQTPISATNIEPPPEIFVHGKWKVSGHLLTLSEIQGDKGLKADQEQMDADISFFDAGMTFKMMPSNHLLHWKRTDWHPEPLPADAVIKDYYSTVTGTHSITVTPAKSEGYPGERISVRVTLANTDHDSFFVPVRLADRILLDYRYANGTIGPDGLTTPPPLRSVVLNPGDSVFYDAIFTVPAKPGRIVLYTVPLPNLKTGETVFVVLPEKNGAAKAQPTAAHP